MRTYTYEVTEHSPKSLQAAFPLGTKITADNATSVAEAIARGWYMNEVSLVTKAEAQRNISAVHGAVRWLEKEVKAGHAPTPADFEIRVRGFKYGEVTPREPGQKAPTSELKAKARAFDASQAKLAGDILAGRFGKTALAALTEGDQPTISLDTLREAAEAHVAAGGTVPQAVADLLG